MLGTLLGHLHVSRATVPHTSPVPTQCALPDDRLPATLCEYDRLEFCASAGVPAAMCRSGVHFDERHPRVSAAMRLRGGGWQRLLHLSAVPTSSREQRRADDRLSATVSASLSSGSGVSDDRLSGCAAAIRATHVPDMQR